jgi:hypothetical protein
VAANPVSGVYVTGSFYRRGTFGPTNLDARANLYLASFSPDGALRWVNEAGDDELVGDGTNGTDVRVDATGNIYLTGFFSGRVARFGGLSVTNSGTDGHYSDVFLAKYDQYGAVKWVTSAGGTRHEFAGRVALDLTGDIYVAGSFESGIANFGGVWIADTFTNSFGWGSGDGFLAKYTANGDIISVQRFGGSGHDLLIGVALDPAGNLFVAGAYTSTDMALDLPPSEGSYDSFLAKFETPVPPLLAVRSTGLSTAELAWSALSERFYLESAPSFQSPFNWQSNPAPIQRIGATNRVSIDTVAQGKVYRLRRNTP